MNNILYWVKGFGFAVSSLIAFSGSSAVALNLQSSSDLNTVELNGAVEKQKFQDFVAVSLPNKRLGTKTCWLDEDGYKRCIEVNP